MSFLLVLFFFHFSHAVDMNPAQLGTSIVPHCILRKIDSMMDQEDDRDEPVLSEAQSCYQKLRHFTFLERNLFSLDIEKGVDPGKYTWNKILELSNNSPDLALRIANDIGGWSNNPILNKEITESFLERLSKKIISNYDKNKSSPILKEIAQLKSQSKLHIYDLNKLSSLTYDLIPQLADNQLKHSTTNLGIDLPLELKKAINKTQPQKDPYFFKGYHIETAARIACRCKEEGASPFLGIPVQRTMGVTHRAYKLCNIVDKDLSEKRAQIFFSRKNPEISWAKIIEKAKCPGDKECENIDTLLGFREFDSNKKSWTQIQKYLIRLGHRLDAAELVREGERLKINLGQRKLSLCFPDRANTTDIYNPVDVVKAAMGGNSCKKKQWSQERCSEAIKVLNEWAIDFQWTAEQHSIGAKFGYGNCTKGLTVNDIENQACKSLEKLGFSPQIRQNPILTPENKKEVN